MRVEPNEWRIQMLAAGSGFPNSLGFDDFGLRLGGPRLNGKTVSIRSSGANEFLMRVPALIAVEMQKDAVAGTSFAVDAHGVVTSPVAARARTGRSRRAAAGPRAARYAPRGL